MVNDLEKNIRSLYSLVGATEEDHFLFTSSGAEGINHVLLAAFFDVTRKEGKNHFMTASIAEAPQILAIGRLEEALCCHTLLPVDDAGQITLQAVEQALTPRTALLSLSTACSLSGVIQHHLPAIGKLCRERKVIFHLDITHTLPTIPFSWEETAADVVTFDGEGIGGPQGSGGMMIRQGHEMSPLLLGGPEQGGMRAGSYACDMLCALAQTAEAICNNRHMLQIEGAMERMRFEEGLKERLNDIEVLFENEERIPSLSLIDFKGIYGEGLHLLLQKRAVATTLGGGHLQRLPALLKAHGRAGFGALSFLHPSPHSVETIAEAVTHLRKYVEAL